MVAGLGALNLQDDFDTIRARVNTAIMDTLSKENIQKGMRESYENEIKKGLKTFIEGELQKEINHLNKNIYTMLSHLDDYKKEEAALRFLRSKIFYYIEKLNVVQQMKFRSI